MAWTTPKIDWVAADNPGPEDFTRIEDNENYLKDQADTAASNINTLKNRATATENDIAKIKSGATAAGNAKKLNNYGGGVSGYYRMRYTATDDKILQANTERSQSESSYKILKEFRIGHAGTYRLGFQAKSYGSSWWYVTLEVDGKEDGTFTGSNSGYQSYSKNMARLDPEAVVTIKGKNVYVRNAWIGGAPATVLPPAVLTN